MGGASTAGSRIGPVCHHFGIGHDFVEQPEQRDIGIQVKEVITDFSRQFIPRFRVRGLGQFQIFFVDKFVLVVVHWAFAVIAHSNPFLDGPDRDEVGPEHVVGCFFPHHASDASPVYDLDFRLHPDFIEKQRQGFSHLWQLFLAGALKSRFEIPVL